MRLVTFEFFLRHGSLPNMWLVRLGGGKDAGALGDFGENRKCAPPAIFKAQILL
jgi:hypothetical protein